MVQRIDTDRLAELIDRLANSLQTAVLLCTSVEPTSRQLAKDASDLCHALDEVTSRLHAFRTGGAR
jgi:hypothetical protein